MKKLLLILLIAAIFITSALSFGCGSSKLSGTYEGTLPAADAPGLLTLITFNSDNTFHMEETFLEKDVETRITDGKWSLNGNVITFTAGDYKFEFKIISEKEIMWAPGGEEITDTDRNWSLFKK